MCKLFKRIFGRKKETVQLSATNPDYVMNDYDWGLLAEVNKFRNMKNLKALTYDPELSYIAAPHSEYMATMLEGGNHNAFANRAAHFPKRHIKENVAVNYKAAMGAVHAWSESPGHLEAMIGNFDYFGCATAKDVKGRVYVTMLFMK